MTDLKLTLGIGQAEELGNVNQLCSLASDQQGKVLVRDAAVVSLRPVHRRLNLDSDVKCFWEQRQRHSYG